MAAAAQVAAGSGFLQPTLFDFFAENQQEPAFCYALQATRCSQPGVFTCQSGGFIASGAVCRGCRCVVRRAVTSIPYCCVGGRRQGTHGVLARGPQ